MPGRLQEGVESWMVIGILVGGALVPPLAFTIAVRNLERYKREPMGPVLGLFLYGGTAGVVLAILLGTLLNIGFTARTGGFGIGAALFATVVAAPILEELSKAFGLGLARVHMDEVEDGIVYGAAIGLGFAATENLTYGVRALADGGVDMLIGTLFLRIFSTTILHAGLTALVGLGYALAVSRGGVALEALPFYLMSALIHAGYNLLVYKGETYGFIAAVVLALVLAQAMRQTLRRLDATPPLAVARPPP